MWGDSDPVGDGTVQYLGQGIGAVCWFEFQPGALGSLLHRAQPFQARGLVYAKHSWQNYGIAMHSHLGLRIVIRALQICSNP